MDPIMEKMHEMQYQIGLLHERDRQHDVVIRQLTQKVKENHEANVESGYANNVGAVKEDVEQLSDFLLWAVSQIKALKLFMHGPYTAHLTEAERGEVDPNDRHVFGKDPIDAIRALIVRK